MVEEWKMLWLWTNVCKSKNSQLCIYSIYSNTALVLSTTFVSMNKPCSVTPFIFWFAVRGNFFLFLPLPFIPDFTSSILWQSKGGRKGSKRLRSHIYCAKGWKYVEQNVSFCHFEFVDQAKKHMLPTTIVCFSLWNNDPPDKLYVTFLFLSTFPPISRYCRSVNLPT